MGKKWVKLMQGKGKRTGAQCLDDDHLWLVTLYVDQVESLLVVASVPVGDRFGWIMFGAVELKQISQTVNTTAGEITTADTIKMSLSLVAQVF